MRSVEICGASKLMRGSRCASTDIAIYVVKGAAKVPLCMKHWLRYSKTEPNIEAEIGSQHVTLRN